MKSWIKIIFISICFFCCACSRKDSRQLSGENLYLRGTFNDWGISVPFLAADDTYVAGISLPPGAYEFKVGSENWSEVNLGGVTASPFELNREYPLQQTGVNVHLQIENNTDLVFKLSMDDVSHPKLKIVTGKLKNND